MGMTQKFTAEEVREKAHGYSLRGDDRTAAMLDALADRIEAAARAVPVAWMNSRTECVYETREEVPLTDGDEYAAPLFPHPPAQAAQVERSDTLDQAEEDAELGGTAYADTLSKPADSGRVGYEFLWQEGQAGEANIVTFNGEDVRGVARIEKDSVRAQLIRSHNNALRSALAAQAVDVVAIKTLLELVEDEHGGGHTEADCRYCVAVNTITRAIGNAQADGSNGTG